MSDEDVDGSPASSDPERSAHPIGTAFETMEVDEGSMFLTVRQATVLAMREREADQRTIARQLGCSRANVSTIERSARENIDKTRKTLSFAEVLITPVRVELPADLPLHEAPDRSYAACDEVEVKVNHGAPELIRRIAAVSSESEHGGRLVEDLVVTVTSEGEVHMLTPS